MGSDMILKGMKNDRNFLESTAVVFWSLVLIPVLMVCLTAVPAWGQFKGYDSDLSTAVLIDIDSDSGLGSIPSELASCPSTPPAPPNTVFSVGFTSGFAYKDNTLYGLEWDGTDIYLYTMSSSSGCAIGTRVGSQPVGFPDLESLVYVPGDVPGDVSGDSAGVFYSVAFFTGDHTGQLIRIDPATGIGTAVGVRMSRDVWVGGLAYDSVTDVLYAVTLSFGGTRGVELLTIDRNTGVEILLGATGTANNSLQSLGIDSSVTPAKLFAAGTMLYELDRSTGVATLVSGGNFTGTVWGMASEAPSAAVDPVPDIKANGSDGSVTPTDTLLVTVALDPGSRSGANADWWVAANVLGTSTIDGWWYYNLNTSGFVHVGNSPFNLIFTHQGALFNLATYPVLNNIQVSDLPSGTYTFYFAVDMNRNGLLDLGSELFFDSVTVVIP